MNKLYKITDELGYEWAYAPHETRFYLLAAEEEMPNGDNGYPVYRFSDLQEYVAEGGSVAGFNEDDAKNFLDGVRPLFDNAERR